MTGRLQCAGNTGVAHRRQEFFWMADILLIVPFQLSSSGDNSVEASGVVLQLHELFN